MLAEIICCLWTNVIHWGGLYDVLDSRLNSRVWGRTPTGPRPPDTWHRSSWSVRAPRLWQDSVLVFRTGSVNNIAGRRMWRRGRVILTEAVQLVRNYSGCPQIGHRSGTDLCHSQSLGMSTTNSLTSVIEMQEEYCICIKWRTILTQTGGAVARENKLMEELSAPRGLVGKTCRRVYD